MLPVTYRPLTNNKTFEIDKILEGDKLADNVTLNYPAFLEDSLYLVYWFDN
jgi:hypothetical protein